MAITDSSQHDTVHTSEMQCSASGRSFCRALFIVFFLLQLTNALIPTKTIPRYAVDFAALVFLPLILIGYAWVANRSLLTTLPIEMKVTITDGCVGIIVGILLAFILLSVFGYQHFFWPFLYEQSGSVTLDGYAPSVFMTPSSRWLVWSLLWLLPAISEELFYKTVLLRSISHLPSRLSFVSVSFIAFSVAHFEQGILAMFAIGIAYAIPSAIYYYQTRRIGPLLIVHAAVDAFTSIDVFFFQ